MSDRTTYDGNDISKLDKERRTVIDAVFNESLTESPLKKIRASRVNPMFKAEMEDIISRYYDIDDPQVRKEFNIIIEHFGQM